MSIYGLDVVTPSSFIVRPFSSIGEISNNADIY